jgi:hypothetical protein
MRLLGIRPSFKEHFLPQNVEPLSDDSQLVSFAERLKRASCLALARRDAPAGHAERTRAAAGRWGGRWRPPQQQHQQRWQQQW